MARYKIWDGVESIITPAPDPKTNKQVYTPEEFKIHNPLAAVPGMYFIIANSPINGAVIMEANHTAGIYRQQGADIPLTATPQQIAAAIEAWEDNEAATGREMALEQNRLQQELMDAQMAACDAQVKLAEMAEIEVAIKLDEGPEGQVVEAWNFLNGVMEGYNE